MEESGFKPNVKEEKKTDEPNHMTMEDYESKLAQMYEVVQEQAFMIEKLTNQVNSQSSDKITPMVKSTYSNAPFLVKPRDIPLLSLKDLEGLEASGKLHMFLDRVELVTPLQDDARVEVAKTRLDPPI